MSKDLSDKNSSKGIKVAVAMSGGVDSSVAALLLKKQGYDCVGVFMKNYDDSCDGSECSASLDYEEARKAAHHLSIPLYTFNFEKEYAERVLNYFYREYQSGRTPNPDVMCNKEIKFKVFLDKILKLGCQYMATGHYTRREVYKDENGKERYKLLKGVDGNKDQSYFLYALNQYQLKHSLFPIGELTKPEVRKLARKFKLPNAERPDSQGICFVGEVSMVDFLGKKIKNKIGKIVTVDGDIVGEHKGAMYYTIGQRKGIGVLGGSGAPYYVVDKDVKKNLLIVAKGQEDKLLYKKELIAEKIHWISEAPKLPLRCSAKIRYRQPDQKCVVRVIRGSKSKVKVIFDDPQRAVTAGQAIVFYNGDVVVGGGVIK